MAKTSMKIKQSEDARSSPPVRIRAAASAAARTLCSRKYGICRICFRELAYKGQIPGVRKASW